MVFIEETVDLQAETTAMKNRWKSCLDELLRRKSTAIWKAFEELVVKKEQVELDRQRFAKKEHEKQRMEQNKKYTANAQRLREKYNVTKG